MMMQKVTDTSHCSVLYLEQDYSVVNFITVKYRSVKQYHTKTTI